MGLFGAVVFLPLFFQLVLGKTASMAGLMMAPLMGGVITASIGGGRLVSRTGRYKIFPIIGLFTATVAFLTMAWAATADERQWMEAALVALGIGLGLVMPTLVVAIQNAVARTDLGIATSAAMFCRSLGSAVGVAVAGAIMTFSLHQLLPANPAVNRDDVNRSIDRGIKEIDNLPEPERLAVIEAYRHSIAITFLAGSGVVCVALIVVLFLPERPLTRSLALGDGAAGET
jgi:MFS family permease